MTIDPGHLERTVLAEARTSAALDALAGVIGILRRQGGFMKPEDQHTYRAARALLAEHGRTIGEE